MEKIIRLLLTGVLLVSLIGLCQAAGWEEKWKNTLAEAKKEGSVSVYSIWKADVRTELTHAFKKKYGINVEFTAFGRGEELLPRVQAEQRAGLYMADVFGGGDTLTVIMKPAGVLRPLKPLLILPEVLDPKAWRAGAVPFIDEEGFAIAMIGTVIRTVLINTDLIKENEITSLKDLLNTKYRGKITLGDPSKTGSLNSSLVHLDLDLWGEEETIKFLKQLIKEQEAVVIQDLRLLVESVARGKYAIGFGPNAEITAQFMANGAPLKMAMVKEDNRVSPSAGGVGVPTKFAHPNAAMVFVNWLLTKEGQSVYAGSFGGPSTRIDASTKGINPIFIPQQGKKYYGDSAEMIAARAKWLEIAKKIIE